MKFVFVINVYFFVIVVGVVINEIVVIKIVELLKKVRDLNVELEFERIKVR